METSVCEGTVDAVVVDEARGYGDTGYMVTVKLQ